MPVHQLRESWILSEDGQQLTMACEHGDRVLGDDDGFQEPPRWYLVGSASFAAVDPSPAQTWSPRYRRRQRDSIPNPFPGEPGQRVGTTCDELGEELTLSCTSTKLPLLGPNATIKYTRQEDDRYDVRWEPKTRRTVTGLSCVVTATKVNSVPFRFYEFPDFGFQISVDIEPSLFFSNRGPTVERVVYSDYLQYATFREAVLTPFNAEPPAQPLPAP